MTRRIKRIHINQHVIKRNAKLDLDVEGALEQLEPPITCKGSDFNHYGFEVIINQHTKVVYRPHKPLSCGAKVWIETTEPVEIVQQLDLFEQET